MKYTRAESNMAISDGSYHFHMDLFDGKDRRQLSVQVDHTPERGYKMVETSVYPDLNCLEENEQLIGYSSVRELVDRLKHEIPQKALKLLEKVSGFVDEGRTFSLDFEFS